MASPCGRKLIEMCLTDVATETLSDIRQEIKSSVKSQQQNEGTAVESEVLKTARPMFQEALKNEETKKKVTKLLRTKHMEIYEAALMLREIPTLMQIVFEKNILFINRFETQYLNIEIDDPVCRVTLNKRILIEVPNTTEDRWPVHFGKFVVKNRVLRLRFSIKNSDASEEERQDRLETVIMKIRQLDVQEALRCIGYLRRTFHFHRETHIFFTQHDDLEDMPPSSKRNSMEVVFKVKD